MSSLGPAAPVATTPPLWRASMTLLIGGVGATVLPLALGPWLTRLYTPEQWGLWQWFAAVAASIAVVACGRFEFALPLEPDPDKARALRSLSCWCLVAVVLLAGVGGGVWSVVLGASWPLALPLAVAALGALSLATLWATRDHRFGAMAVSRIVQHGGGALAQWGAGLAGLGLHGLLVAPIVAAWVALLGLRLPWRGTLALRDPQVRQAARTHRDFALFNAPHAWSATAVDAVALTLIASYEGAAAAGFWGLAMRYLKAPATLVGAAVSQALYARLAADAACHRGLVSPAARTEVRRSVVVLAGIAAVLAVACSAWAPGVFVWAFGESWRDAGTLARALSGYLAIHFVASPMAVVTMAWNAQAWALSVALVGQALMLVAMAVGLWQGGLVYAGWWLSGTMLLFWGWYLARLLRWPTSAAVAATPMESTG